MTEKDFMQYVLQRADFTISIANTFLVWGALFIALITIGITWYYNREKQKEIKKAISEVLQKICDDDKIRAEFVRDMLQNGNFKDELKAAIDIAARDQIDLDKERIFADNETSQQMKGKL
ncbi:hypothetical protein [Campylobacter showae]|uniref:hypothetical protein n=1 Tax=Campylobacter showae TaxID=204 RepID=UPI0028ED6AF9|nr:hypothetical protein [Campylobacter showae]